MRLITLALLLLLIPTVFAQNETNETFEEFELDETTLEIEELRNEIQILQDEIDELRDTVLTRSEVLTMIQQNFPDENQIKTSLEEELAPPSRFPIYSLIFILFLGVVSLSVYIFKDELSPLLSKLPIKVKSDKKIRHGPQFESLVNYIKENKGTPGLKQKLLSQGWKPHEVREAFKNA